MDIGLFFFFFVPLRTVWRLIPDYFIQCVYVCVCAGVQANMDAHLCMHMGRPETTSGVIL